MNFKLKLGVTVAIIGLYCILVIAFLRGTDLYAVAHRGAGIALGALAIGLMTLHLVRRPAAPPPRAEGGEGVREDELEEAAPVWNFRFTALMALLCGMATYFILPAQSVPVARAAEPPRVARTNPPVAPTNPPPAQFPPLRLQGIYYRPDRPSALINRRTLFVGDIIEGATVVAITPNSVTVEISGARQELLITP